MLARRRRRRPDAGPLGELRAANDELLARLASARLAAQAEAAAPECAPTALRRRAARGAYSEATKPAPAPRKTAPVGFTAKGSKGRDKVLTRQVTLDTIADLIEKKAVADRDDEEKARPKQTMREYMHDYFVFKFGLGAHADAMQARFVMSVSKYLVFDRRCELFARTLGLADVRHYADDLGDLFVDAHRRVYAGNLESIKERLDDGDGACFTSVRRALAAVIGDGATARRDDPRTWDAPVLLRVATPDEVRSCSAASTPCGATASPRAAAAVRRRAPTRAAAGRALVAAGVGLAVAAGERERGVGASQRRRDRGDARAASRRGGGGGGGWGVSTTRRPAAARAVAAGGGGAVVAAEQRRRAAEQRRRAAAAREHDGRDHQDDRDD